MLVWCVILRYIPHLLRIRKISTQKTAITFKINLITPKLSIYSAKRKASWKAGRLYTFCNCSYILRQTWWLSSFCVERTLSQTRPLVCLIRLSKSVKNPLSDSDFSTFISCWEKRVKCWLKFSISAQLKGKNWKFPSIANPKIKLKSPIKMLVPEEK